MKLTISLLLKDTNDLLFFLECKLYGFPQSEKTRERSEAVATLLKKETLPQVFSCEFCEISKNGFSNRTPPVASTERWKIVKPITMQRIFLNKSSLCKKRYKGFSINSCFVDVSAITNTSSKQQIRLKLPTTSAV